MRKKVTRKEDDKAQQQGKERGSPEVKRVVLSCVFYLRSLRQERVFPAFSLFPALVVSSPAPPQESLPRLGETSRISVNVCCVECLRCLLFYPFAEVQVESALARLSFLSPRSSLLLSSLLFRDDVNRTSFLSLPLHFRSVLPCVLMCMFSIFSSPGFPREVRAGKALEHY